MTDLLKYIRNILGFGATEERNILQNRKRRLIHEDHENYSAKLRKLNENKMSYNNFDEWADLASTSKTKFLKFIPPRRTIRPLTMKSANTEVIDLSDDDDDVIEVASRRKFGSLNGTSSGSSISKLRSTSPHNLFSEARRTMKNSSRLLNGGSHSDINQSIRLDEQQLYRDMLLSSPRTSAVYSNSAISSTSTPTRKYDYQESSSRANKILNLLKSKRTVPVIDLTEDKSNRCNEPIVIKDDSDIESVGRKKKIEPVNSLQKVLDNEPFMNPNYLINFEEQRNQRKKALEKEITEKRKQRDLYNDANRENINLLLEVKVKNCKISEVVLLDEYPEEDELCFPEFTPEQEARINEALKTRNPNRLFADKYNLRITAHDLKTFNEKEWLNDEVINFYVNMIQERSQREKLPKVYSFSTFFYPKLLSSGYSSLRRWTKRVDIFSFDIIVVPVHLGFHWCMAIIDFRDKSIRYYDSMLGKNTQCLNALENYLHEEHKEKKKSAYDTSDWRKVIMKDIPRQMNGSDCGVFSCTFAEFITRNAKILFTQEHMPYIRRKMVIEIIEGRLLT